MAAPDLLRGVKLLESGDWRGAHAIAQAGMDAAEGEIATLRAALAGRHTL